MFSQTTEYALRAMAWLALSPGLLIPTAQLAEKTHVPPHYLAKVLQQLSAAKLIRGRRGVSGGYQLARTAREISLLDVVRSVTQVERITKCPLGIASHTSTLCPLHRHLDLAAKAIIETYSTITLHDLVTDPSKVTPLCENGDTAAQLTVSAKSAKR